MGIFAPGIDSERIVMSNSNITIKTKRVKFSMEETPPEQFLNSPFYDCSGDTNTGFHNNFNNNVYFGGYESSNDFGNTNWQNNPYGNIGLGNTVNGNVGALGNPANGNGVHGNRVNGNNGVHGHPVNGNTVGIRSPVSDYFNDVPVNQGMDYGIPKPYMENGTNIDMNNNEVNNNNYVTNTYIFSNNSHADANAASSLNNSYSTSNTTSNNYYSYIGSSSYPSNTTNNSYMSSSAALSSFTVPNAAGGGTSGASVFTENASGDLDANAVASEGSQKPQNPKEENKQPPIARGIANSILLASRVSRPGDGTPLGIVPAKEPGGKDTKIAIATDSVLAPAKHHIARIFNKHGITTSFSPNLEKLTEITGNVAYLFCLYKEFCLKRRWKTVNRETYGKLFRNEFKRKVGSR